MPTQKPNILFLCSDQHQAKAMGCAGHVDVFTPNLDKLATSSQRFDHAYCQSPVCVPARGSIITGLYPHAHGARILKDALPTHVKTIAHHFSANGYQTAAIGKMHFVDETQKHGFDYRIHSGDFRKTLTDAEYQTLREDQGGAGDIIGRPSHLPARFFQDTYFADQTIQYLKQERDPNRPFCLWSSYVMPHTPLVPMRQYFDQYDPPTLTLPPRAQNPLQTGFEGHLIRAKERGWYDQTDRELQQSLAGYYGNITQMDACIGRVLDTLETEGLSQNTIVVYTSDHGEMAGAHRMWTKHNMYEQSVNVPLLIRLPDHTNTNTVNSDLIEHIDLYPTLSDLCNLPAPPNIHGQSFAPLLRGEPYTPRPHVYSEYDFCHNVFTQDNRYIGKPPILMIRTKNWKLNYLSWSQSELFDLQNDPHEFTNVIHDPTNAHIVQELTTIAQQTYQQ